MRGYLLMHFNFELETWQIEKVKNHLKIVNGIDERGIICCISPLSGNQEEIVVSGCIMHGKLYEEISKYLYDNSEICRRLK